MYTASIFKVALAVLCAVNVLIAASIAPSGDYFLPNFLSYGVMLLAPVAIFLLFFYSRLDIVFTGALAIIVVFLLERHWETTVHVGRNSMPFVFYVIVCAPLTIIGSCVAYWICRVLKKDRSWPQLISTFSTGVVFGVSGFIKNYF